MTDTACMQATDMSEKYYDHVLPEREEKIRLIRCKIIVLEAELERVRRT